MLFRAAIRTIRRIKTIKGYGCAVMGYSGQSEWLSAFEGRGRQVWPPGAKRACRSRTLSGLGSGRLLD